MARYYEYIGENGNTVIDDSIPRYSLSRIVHCSELLLECQIDESIYSILGPAYGRVPDNVRAKSFMRFTVQLNDSECIVALKPRIKNDSVGYLTRAKTVANEINIYIANASDLTDETIINNLDIYVYKDDFSSTSSHIGLEIYDENGKIIFNTDSLIFDVRACYNNDDLRLSEYWGSRTEGYGMKAISNPIIDIGISNDDYACVVNSYAGCVFYSEATYSVWYMASAYVVFAPNGMLLRAFAGDAFFYSGGNRLYTNPRYYNDDYDDPLAKAYNDNCFLLFLKV